MENNPLNSLPIIGKLPEIWQIVKLSDVIHSTRNGIYKQKEFHGSGIKIVNMGELFAHPRLKSIPMKRVELTKKELENFLLNEGDLLFARRSLVAEGAGKCSIVCQVTEPTTFESSIIRIRPNKEVLDSCFLYYIFSSPFGKYLLLSIRRQVAVSGITGTDLINLEIPLPPLQEQRTIANILGTLDDKISLNREMNETLEGMARAIFKSWFVDFELVKAKAAGLETGLPPEIECLFPDRLEDLENITAPNKWGRTPIFNIAKYINGTAFKSKDFSKKFNGKPIVKIAELKNGITSQTQYTEKDIDSKYKIDNGEILFSWSGSPDTSIDTFIWTLGPAWLNQHIFRVVPKISTNRYFIYYLLKSLKPVFIEIARDKQTTGLGHVTAVDLKGLKVCLPPQNVINRFNELIAPIFDYGYQLKIESQLLSDLRDTLLPRLISGELRIPEMETLLKEAI